MNVSGKGLLRIIFILTKSYRGGCISINFSYTYIYIYIAYSPDSLSNTLLQYLIVIKLNIFYGH